MYKYSLCQHTGLVLKQQQAVGAMAPVSSHPQTGGSDNTTAASGQGS